MTTEAGRRRIPRLRDDYSQAAAAVRRDYLASVTGTYPSHVGDTAFDPRCAAGNLEDFIGVAQVPIGIAGPQLVRGEHTCGEFYVPLATTEGTLVASYNRGMKLAHRAGGVRVSVVADRMQRAPVFGFDSAAEAKTFGIWVSSRLDEIRSVAESTTRTGKLQDIEQFSASRYLFLRLSRHGALRRAVPRVRSRGRRVGGSARAARPQPALVAPVVVAPSPRPPSEASPFPSFRRALFPFVAHQAALPQASLMISHGGHGSVTAALAHGVPLVCVPCTGADQPVVAARGASALEDWLASPGIRDHRRWPSGCHTSFWLHAQATPPSFEVLATYLAWPLM